MPDTVLRNLASVKRHGANITSTNSLSYVQSRAALKDLPHPLLLYHLLAGEASSPPKYLNIESLHWACSQRVLLDLNAGINMLDSVIRTPGRCCLLYWHLALQLLPQAVSPPSSPISQGQVPAPSVSKSLPLPMPIPSLPHGLSEGEWCTHTDTENNATKVQNHEKLKWHYWSVKWTRALFLSSSNRKILLLICFNCSHKLNLMSLPIHSSFPLRYKTLCLKSPNLQLPPCRKFLPVFYGRCLSEENDLGYKEIYWQVKKAKTLRELCK